MRVGPGKLSSMSVSLYPLSQDLTQFIKIPDELISCLLDARIRLPYEFPCARIKDIKLKYMHASRSGDGAFDISFGIDLLNGVIHELSGIVKGTLYGVIADDVVSITVSILKINDLLTDKRTSLSIDMDLGGFSFCPSVFFFETRRLKSISANNGDTTEGKADGDVKIDHMTSMSVSAATPDGDTNGGDIIISNDLASAPDIGDLDVKSNFLNPVDGVVNITSDGCYELVPSNQNTLVLYGRCVACCQCAGYVFQTNRLSDLARDLKSTVNEYDASHQSYEDTVWYINENSCENTSIRPVMNMIPLDDPHVSGDGGHMARFKLNGMLVNTSRCHIHVNISIAHTQNQRSGSLPHNIRFTDLIASSEGYWITEMVNDYPEMTDTYYKVYGMTHPMKAGDFVIDKNLSPGAVVKFMVLFFNNKSIYRVSDIKRGGALVRYSIRGIRKDRESGSIDMPSKSCACLNRSDAMFVSVPRSAAEL